MNLKAFACFLVIATQASAYAHGVAYSTLPLAKDKKMFSSEITGDVSEGGGLGMQGRFVYIPTMVKGSVDAGLGIASGERNMRFFTGYDYEIFPDYKEQPRVSLKSMFEWVKEDGEGIKKFSVAPVVSKGFSFWGKEGYPYASLPVGIALNGNKSTYQNYAELAFGVAGQLPVEGYTNLMANLEANVNLANSSSGIRVGVSYPFN